MSEQQDIEEDIKINGWRSVEKISEVKDSMRMLGLFQDFYTTTKRLPPFNGLLVVPDGDAQPGENKINMKQLYDLFKNTYSHGLVSLPFLGLLLHFFESSQDLEFIKDATTELYKNIFYMSLSGARNFEFDAVSDFIAHLSFAIRGNTIKNTKRRQEEHDLLAKKINDGRIFEPKIQNPLEDVIEILDGPNPEHKKTTFPYVEPTVQFPDEIEDSQKRIDDDFTDLISKINRVNDVIIEQKKQKDIEDVIESVIKDPIPTNKYWWEDDIFSKTDKQPTIDATKIIVDDIKQTTNDILKDIYIQVLSDNILRNLRPVGNRNIQQLIDDDFIPIDDRTQQEREDDDNISLLSEDDNISLLSENDDAVTIEDVVEPTFTTNTAIVEPTTTSNTPKNHFIVTIENVLEPPATVNQIPSLAPPKTLDVDINALSNNIFKNLQPVDNRNIQQLIEDNFIPIDDRTQQEREDDDNISLEGEAPPIIDIDTTSAWDQNKTEIARPGPIIKLSTDYDRKVKVAKKVKNKYLKKKIGQINTQNKASKDWLKSSGFLDTKDQDKINYIFVPPKKVEINKIPGDAAHFIRTEIDSTDFKKENLATKIRRNKNIRKPYKKMPDTGNKDKDETIQILDNIAILEPGKNAQIAPKKISKSTD